MSKAPILVSDRVLRRNVGGNTTYARAVIDGLSERDLQMHPVGPPATSWAPARATSYLAFETLLLPRQARTTDAGAIFFPADTGPVVRSRTPTVVTVHGLAAIHVKGIRSPAAEKIWMKRVGLAVRSADRVITVSESSADDLMKYFGLAASEIDVIPHGIDQERFHTQPTSGGPALSGLPDEYVLFLGNLEPRKNVTALIGAFEDDRVRNLPLRLVIAGKPAWDADQTLAAIENSERTTHLGWVDEADVLPLLQGASMFVFPSLYEGFGFPVLEAMAAGCPVISSTNGALKEIAADAALTLSDTDSSTIADAIVRLYNDRSLKDELRRRGIARAGAYSWARSFDAHAKVFSELIGT